MNYPAIDPQIAQILLKGTVIPAHPLALTADRAVDICRQRRLTRYYLASGAGGIAVGVHTTQFEIRDPDINLLKPVLQLAAEEIRAAGTEKPVVMIAGICGPLEQALQEAELARSLGYHLGLLSMGGLSEMTEGELLDRARKVARVIPLFGFYLQEAVGGRTLGYRFWKEFVEIPNVCAIKIAAFNRYQTLDVVRAVAESTRRDQIALYTGNDDNIIADLITPFRFSSSGQTIEKRMVGGLLGQWAVWTSKAVELLEEIHRLGPVLPEDFLTLNGKLTDANGAIFDAANSFIGCIPGIHEILRRQGLLNGTWCLNEKEVLSAGQSENIDRVCQNYPELSDDLFVEQWLTRDAQTGGIL